VLAGTAHLDKGDEGSSSVGPVVDVHLRDPTFVRPASSGSKSWKRAGLVLRIGNLETTNEVKPPNQSTTSCPTENIASTTPRFVTN
jgi:hypothetical protein